MYCPMCQSEQCYVKYTENLSNYTVRRRRKCADCGHVFYAYERIVTDDYNRALEYRRSHNGEGC